MVQERHADGGRIDSAYNAFGDKVSSAERVTDSRTVVTNYAYDKLSRLEQTSLAQTSLAPGITRYEICGADGTQINPGITQTVLETNQYDEAGRKERVINGNQEATRYRYDRAGNVVLSGQETVKVTDLTKKPGIDAPVAPLAYQMRYRYDAVGHKVGQTDAAGMSQSWTYDTFGRLIGRTDGKTGGGTVDYSYAYNRAGDLTHEGNGAGKSLDYRYDGAGQRIEIRDNNLGQSTNYGYDLAGNRVSEKMVQKTLLSSGVLDNVVYQDNHLVYDAQNRLRAVFDSRADVRITYDLAGNGSEFASHAILEWIAQAGIATSLSDPGKPWQNGTDESFNGKFRDECLSLECFRSRREAVVVIDAWRRHYKAVRAHSSLDYLTPHEVKQQHHPIPNPAVLQE